MSEIGEFDKMLMALHSFGASHNLTNPRGVAERLAIWSEQARRVGRAERADQLLLSAWSAYDLSANVKREGQLPAAMFVPSGNAMKRAG